MMLLSNTIVHREDAAIVALWLLQVSKRKWGQLLKLVTPKFKGRPPAVVLHNFLVCVFFVQNEPADVEQYVSQQLKNDSIPSASYMDFVPQIGDDLLAANHKV
jgi:hypothetical protein